MIDCVKCLVSNALLRSSSLLHSYPPIFELHVKNFCWNLEIVSTIKEVIFPFTFSSSLRFLHSYPPIFELRVKNLCWNLEIVSTIMEVIVDEGVTNYAVELT